MNIDGCEFPDDLLYDSEGLTWVRVDGDDLVLGITSIHAALGGRLGTVKAKPLGVEYERGKTIGTIEGGKYFGPIRTPVSGVLRAVNGAVLERPKTVSESPYAEGWFARLRPTRWAAERAGLREGRTSETLFRSQITSLRVRCFAAFPDHEMFEIGTECAAVLVKLAELVDRIPVGDVVHLVSDDPTSPLEMTRWSDQTGHAIVESRQEGNLFHFLVRKVQ